MSVTFSRKNQDILLRIAAKATGSTGWSADAEALLVSVNGKARAVIVFQNATLAGAEIHLASVNLPMRPTSDMIEAIRMYAGQVRGWPSLIATIPAYNAPSQILALRLGAKPFGFVPEAKSKTADLILYRIDGLNAKGAADDPERPH